MVAGEAPGFGDYGQDYAYISRLQVGETRDFELFVTIDEFTQAGDPAAAGDVWLLVDTDEWIPERFEYNNLLSANLTGACEDSHNTVVCGKNATTYVSTTGLQLPTASGNTGEFLAGNSICFMSRTNWVPADWFKIDREPTP